MSRSLLAWVAAAVSALAGPVLASPVFATQCADARIDDPTPEDGAFFGWSVALSAERVLVGARSAGATGEVEVYDSTGLNPSWGATLVPSDAPGPFSFGWDVAIDGDTAIVGRPDGVTVGPSGGSAYVFERGGGGWTEVHKLVPSSAGALGRAVAIDGDTLAVGAPGGLPMDWRGVVYVYRRVAGTWTLEAELRPNDAAPKDTFGHSLDLDGERLIVGAPERKVAGDSGVGGAYVFERGAVGWAQVARFDPPDSHRGRFGFSVALSGAHAAVGEPFDTEPGYEPRAGRIRVFSESGGTWSHSSTLFASDGGRAGNGLDLSHIYRGYIYDSFGTSVDLDGDCLVAGAPLLGKSQEQRGTPGAGYVFERDALTGWHETRRVVAPAGEVGYGQSVALLGDELLLGGPSSGVVGFVPGGVWRFDLAAPGGAETYCVRRPNSAGSGARIGYLGSLSILTNELWLLTSGAPAGETAVYFHGASAQQVPLGDGALCVGGALFRLAAGSVGPQGNARRRLRFHKPPADAGAGRITPGSTWYFQLWYRDPSGPGGSGSNLSDGLRVTFCR